MASSDGSGEIIDVAKEIVINRERRRWRRRRQRGVAAARVAIIKRIAAYVASLSALLAFAINGGGLAVIGVTARRRARGVISTRASTPGNA
jgi:hypothetical protein